MGHGVCIAHGRLDFLRLIIPQFYQQHPVSLSELWTPDTCPQVGLPSAGTAGRPQSLRVGRAPVSHGTAL